LAIVLLSPCAARASECPSTRSEIATDRPDVTNSSLVVPAGSIQSENGINTSRQSAGAAFDGSNSRLRFGVAPCLELLVDIPGYIDQQLEAWRDAEPQPAVAAVKCGTRALAGGI